MMEAAAEKALGEVVSTAPQLAGLIRAQRLFEALDGAIQPGLSEPLRRHLRVACVDQGTLVLAAQSSAWASRARLEAAAALDAARALWPGPIRQVKVIVAPWHAESESGASERRST